MKESMKEFRILSAEIRFFSPKVYLLIITSLGLNNVHKIMYIGYSKRARSILQIRKTSGASQRLSES